MTLLERLRTDAFLTPEDLAGLTGVSSATIRNLEQGRVVRPQMATLRALAQHFDVPASDLLKRKPTEAAA